MQGVFHLKSSKLLELLVFSMQANFGFNQLILNGDKKQFLHTVLERKWTVFVRNVLVQTSLSKQKSQMQNSFCSASH